VRGARGGADAGTVWPAVQDRGRPVHVQGIPAVPATPRNRPVRVASGRSVRRRGIVNSSSKPRKGNPSTVETIRPDGRRNWMSLNTSSCTTTRHACIQHCDACPRCDMSSDQIEGARQIVQFTFTTPHRTALFDHRQISA
jgi:hypothetical protein